VVGFAAETGNLEARAARKLEAKGCDWLLANDVSEGKGVFGGSVTEILFISRDGREPWGRLSKREVGLRLAERIAAHLAK
jgi:phosphopantothenoylcysteine decarboxylase / phosphopantothenate---cysteine ligase